MGSERLSQRREGTKYIPAGPVRLRASPPLTTYCVPVPQGAERDKPAWPRPWEIGRCPVEPGESPVTGHRAQ